MMGNVMNKKKILLIDDDREFAQELGEALAINGYAVTITGDVNDVLNVAKKSGPDVILLDLKMPEKNGFQVARELHEDAETKGIPVIAISACYRNGEFFLMRIDGIKKYLGKPFSPEEVIAEIESVLAKR